MRVWMWSLALAVLPACSTWQPPPAELPLAATDGTTQPGLRFSGRMSLRLDAWASEPARGESFQFDLQGTASAGVLDISTPFGTLVASVRWSPAGASLLTPEGAQVFDSIDALLVQALGEPLPVHTLMQWLAGHPAPDAPHNALSPSHPEQHFQQLGWEVDLQELHLGTLQAQRPASPALRGARLVIRLDP